MMQASNISLQQSNLITLFISVQYVVEIKIK